MIVIDTSVLSELIRPKPAFQVTNWLAGLEHVKLATTAVTRAELEHHVYRLPEGERRNEFRGRLVQLLSSQLSLPVLPFDDAAARIYPVCAQGRQEAGLPRNIAKLMIAAIARAQEAQIAARSLRDYEAMGVDVINPWQD